MDIAPDIVQPGPPKTAVRKSVDAAHASSAISVQGSELRRETAGLIPEVRIGMRVRHHNSGTNHFGDLIIRAEAEIFVLVVDTIQLTGTVDLERQVSSAAEQLPATNGVIAL